MTSTDHSQKIVENNETAFCINIEIYVYQMKNCQLLANASSAILPHMCCLHLFIETQIDVDSLFNKAEVILSRSHLTVALNRCKWCKNLFYRMQMRSENRISFLFAELVVLNIERVEKNPCEIIDFSHLVYSVIWYGTSGINITVIRIWCGDKFK